ncbi:hypothetical protein [Sphaerochaeta halotolerans]|uniref:hypothetical protein n=1 Tax=Sphaerochaeta halotolerans TaxID=2293840 RepID=UPI00136E584E|nr:hypothetical protein [Sphaerochaeta halotolerans]MXI87342.1 hypothetical protein [Sphaerochaeta halotolerans]
METIWILTVIFSFIIVVSTLDHRYNLRKKKIEAALRMREMEMGYPPGTYSNLTYRKLKKGAASEASFTEWRQGTNRAELRKGIDELQGRLANLETIMKSRKNSFEGFVNKE